MKAALACLAIVALAAAPALAQTNSGDGAPAIALQRSRCRSAQLPTQLPGSNARLRAVAALTGLQACVAANAKNLAYVYGWNTSSSSSATPSAVPGAASIDATLAAAGVPGVTASGTTPSAPGASASTDPCGTTQPWTGLLCSGGRVTTM